MSLPYRTDHVQIREVWADNLDEEFTLIREIVDEYPYIGMDTEFPGFLAQPLGDSRPIYESLKRNVYLMKLIQLGLTFCNEEGHLPKCGADKFCIWQFNFREFNPNVDMHAPDSVKLLRQCGIDFEKNNKKGVDARLFAELLMSSGVVLNDEVTWITFHSLYDFGYLLKVLTCRKQLPETRDEYLDLIDIFFPVFYDMKQMLRYSDRLHGGLENMAMQVGLERVGAAHQAGSDSLLTSCLFKVVKDGDYLDRSLEDYVGVLYSLERLPPA